MYDWEAFFRAVESAQLEEELELKAERERAAQIAEYAALERQLAESQRLNAAAHRRLAEAERRSAKVMAQNECLRLRKRLRKA